MPHLLLYKYSFKVLLVADVKRLKSAERLFRGRGYKVWRILPPPSLLTLQQWRLTGKARSSDGCEVNGLESCQHGHRSWLAVFKQRKVQDE